MTRSRTPGVDTIDLALLDLLGDHEVDAAPARVAPRRLERDDRALRQRAGGSPRLAPVRNRGGASRRRPCAARAIAASLGLSKDVLPPPPAADPAVAARVVDAATQEVAEKLDAGPIRVRAALARFIAQLAERERRATHGAGILTR